MEPEALDEVEADGDGADDPLRETLLAAAARVFALKGYSGTKIMDIVKESGLSSGAVYGRFDSKDDLLMEAVLSQVRRNAVARRFQGRSVAELLVGASRSDGPLDDVEAMQIEAFIAARREPKVAEAIASARRGWRDTIGDVLIRRAIEEGDADPDADFGSIVYFMETLNLGLLVQRGAGQAPPDPKAWRAFLERIIRTMARSPDADP